MLRKTLLATTALVLCAALAHAEQKGVTPKNSAMLARMFSHGAHAVSAIVRPAARGSQPTHNVAPNLQNAIFSNYSEDANAQYVSWYGYRAENSSYGSICGSASATRTHITTDNAFAFTPPANVTTKKVTVAVFSFYIIPSAEYRVDIYSSVGGLPGSVIAKSKTFTASDTSVCCTSSRTVAIKANLVAGTQYFIGVVGTLDGGNADGGWMMENTDFSGASVDYYHFRESFSYYNSQHHTCHKSTYSSPWHASTYLPTTGAVVLK